MWISGQGTLGWCTYCGQINSDQDKIVNVISFHKKNTLNALSFVFILFVLDCSKVYFNRGKLNTPLKLKVL